MGLTAQQTQVARLLYGVARSHGLDDQRAREFVAASDAEADLNPRAVNKSSGAAGLFQLLSSGYRSRAQAGGGLFNPTANANAIIGDYVNYWKSHPNAAPGEGAAAVERSGEGAGFYSSPLAELRGIGGGAAPAPAQPGPALASPAAPQPDVAPLRLAALQQLIGQVGKANPDYGGFLGAAKNLRTAQAQNQQPAPALKVQVEPGATVGHGAVAAVKVAEKYLGTAYHYGGDSPKTGFDCSGILQWALGQEGIKIPRTTYDQFKTGTPVAKGQLQPGDAVFFEPTKAGPGHVGIYVGGGSFLEAPHTGAVVRISKLAGRPDYVGARRYT